MLPSNHFAVAAVCAVPVSLVQGHSAATTVAWALVSGLVAASMDLDVYLFVLKQSRQNDQLKPFRSIAVMYKQFPLFMETIYRAGIVRQAMLTHWLTSFCIGTLTWWLAKPMLIPVLIAVITHLGSDVPHMVRVLGKARPA